MSEKNGRQTQRAAVMPIDYGRADRRGTNGRFSQYRADGVPVLVQKRTLDLRRAA